MSEPTKQSPKGPPLDQLDPCQQARIEEVQQVINLARRFDRDKIQSLPPGALGSGFFESLARDALAQVDVRDFYLEGMKLIMHKNTIEKCESRIVDAITATDILRAVAAKKKTKVFGR